MTDHHPTDASPQTPTDEGLRCPKCEYNLTGLVDDVCPECGEAFNRARLLASLHEAVGPIPEWSRRHDVGWVRAFLSTLIEMWFFPMRFGRRFPRNPERNGPRHFARICLAISITVSGLTFLFCSSGGLGAALELVAMGLSAFIGVLVCEYMMAGALFSPVEMDVADEAAFASGLALAHMCRSFLVLSSTIMSGDALYQLLSSNTLRADFAMSYLLAAVVVYWWFCMVLITAGHARSRIKILNTLIVAPFIIFFCCVVSCFAAFVLGILMLGFFI